MAYFVLIPFPLSLSFPLQQTLLGASGVLHSALGGKFYFKSVNVVVPSSWHESKCDEVIRRARSDPKFPAHGAGREVTRVVSTGTAQIEVNIVTKDMRNFGYVEDDAGYNYTQ